MFGRIPALGMIFQDNVRVIFLLPLKFKNLVNSFYKINDHSPEAISIIPEVVLGIHIFIIQLSIFAPQNNFIPKNNLKN